MTGSLAPPPPYGSEQGSILLEAGRDGAPDPQGAAGGGYFIASHSRSRSANFANRAGPPTSPGLVRSPTDISLAQLAHIPSHEDLGEGASGAGAAQRSDYHHSHHHRHHHHHGHDHGRQDRESGVEEEHVDDEHANAPPPEYTSPEASHAGSRRSSSDGDGAEDRHGRDQRRALLRSTSPRPPIPSYEAAVGNTPRGD